MSGATISPGLHQLHKTIALNETIAARQLEVANARKATVESHWFERDYHRMSGRIAAATQASGLGAPATASGLVNGTQASRQAGAEEGVGVIKAMRRERLKELYEREALQYERELHAMGLSLAKPRD